MQNSCFACLVRAKEKSAPLFQPRGGGNFWRIWQFFIKYTPPEIKFQETRIFYLMPRQDTSRGLMGKNEIFGFKQAGYASLTIKQGQDWS